MNKCNEAHRLLATYGVLLLQDKNLPSIVGVFAGKDLKGSWWSHSKAHEIFSCLEQFESTEVVPTRLVAGKVTYVHSRLWPALVAVGTGNERWQTEGMTVEARSLLQRLRGQQPVVSKGAASKDLQLRLLVVAEEVHTEAGRHEVRLESWHSWAARFNVVALSTPEEGRRALEEAVAKLGAPKSSLRWRRER